MITNLPDAITEVVTDMKAKSVTSLSYTQTSTELTYIYTDEENIFVAGMFVEIYRGTFIGKRYEITSLTQNSKNGYTI